MTQSLDSPTGIGRISPMALELARLGHQVEVYALDPAVRSVGNSRFNLEGVNVNYVAPMHVRKEGNQKFYYSTLQLLIISFRATWQLTRATLNSQSDIIHICKPHPMNGIAGITAHLLKKKIILVDCDDFEAGSGNFSKAWQKWIVAGFEKFLPRYANSVTTNTIFMREKLISWGVSPGRIFYIPNGVDKNRFQAPDQDEVGDLRRQLGLENKKVIAYIGSLSKVNHPIQLLLEAFVDVNRAFPDSRLLLVGGGEDYEVLRNQAFELGIDDAVIFTGRVPAEFVSLYYLLSDVSIDPVYDDDAARGRSPLKMFESWIAGIPFITGDVGDRKSISGDPPAGIIVEPGNPKALTEAIIQVFNNPILAESLRMRGLSRVKMFTWDHLVRDLETVYRRFSPKKPELNKSIGKK
jgi:glycosyltransferase involved in cell wall biosynthesis